MREGAKTFAAFAALLLALGLAACGGDDGGTGSTTAASGTQAQSTDAAGGDSKGGKGKGSGAEDGGEGGSTGSGEFTREQHDDSGGGSEQFRQEGGDNSVQDFGEEADEAEFDAAAAALHDFLDARAAGDWNAACDYVSKTIVKSFEKLIARAKKADAVSCGEILEQLTNPAARKSMKAEAAAANVGSLRVGRESSFIIYTGAEGTILAMPMANEDGDWKVVSLAGTPLN